MGLLKHQITLFSEKYLNQCKWIFLSGLFLKLVSIPFFSSSYMNDLFIPFIDRAILQFPSNPWNLSEAKLFPYGSFLFLVLLAPKSIGYWLFGELSLGAGFISLYLMKIPLLIFDILLYSNLVNLAPSRTRALCFYYWLNPALFYINFVHSQLDVVSITLGTIAIIKITQEKYLSSALAMSCSILSKFHIVILIPLFFTYIWGVKFQSEAIKKILLWGCVVLTVSISGYLPHYFSNSSLFSVTSSPESLRLFGLKLWYSQEAYIMAGLALVLGILIRILLSTYITKQALLYACGCVFLSLLIATNSAPGWHYWSLPFVALFFAEYVAVSPLIMILYITAYLTHFLIIPLLPDNLINLVSPASLTFLQICMLCILFYIWRTVISTEAPLQRRSKPFVFAIAGNSGSGKDHLSRILSKTFYVGNASLIEGDDYHKWERGSIKWQDYTHLSPQANHLSDLAFHTLELVRGKTISQPHYDHKLGQFSPPRISASNKNIIIQGLHTLYMRGMRSLLDLKIFLEPTENIHLYWKIQRDVLERGHSLQKVLDSIANRKQDSIIHIAPQKRIADWIIQVDTTSKIDFKNISQEKIMPLKYRHIVWNDACLSNLITMLKEEGVNVHQAYDNNEMDRVVIDVTGSITSARVKDIAKILFPNIRHLTRSSFEPIWDSDYNGINQLIALQLVDTKMKMNETTM